MSVDPPGLALDPIEECEMIVNVTVRKWVDLSGRAEVIHALMDLTNRLRLESTAEDRAN